jgi:hypothetical protein
LLDCGRFEQRWLRDLGHSEQHSTLGFERFAQRWLRALGRSEQHSTLDLEALGHRCAFDFALTQQSYARYLWQSQERSEPRCEPEKQSAVHLKQHSAQRFLLLRQPSLQLRQQVVRPFCRPSLPCQQTASR